jgi:hypothetical protein
MGAGFSLKCPQPFVNIDGFSCAMPCPTAKKFVRINENGSYKCVYGRDPAIFVNLSPLGALAMDGETGPLTLEDVKKNPKLSQEYTAFVAEKDRFEKEITVIYGNIDKQRKIEDAFNDLQKAENVRDQSPSAYQAARTAYYTLIKGADWINEERQRVSAAEVAPEVQKYREAVNAVNVRTQEQQKTIDVVNGIKDKVLSLKDDFKYSVSTFSDQLEKVKIQLNMENRSREKERDNTWTWVDLGLNVLLVAVLLYAVYTFARRYFLQNRTVPATTIRIPTYTGQVV